MSDDRDKIIYNRQSVGLWCLIKTPPPPARWSAEWWGDRVESFWFNYGRVVTFFGFWALAYLVLRAGR